MPPSRPNLLDPHLVRALAHPLRVQILEVLNERQASPNELMEILDYPLGNVAYHTRVLEKCGCIELVTTERRRGAIEHFFRAKPRSYIGHQDWRKVPRSVRNEISGASLEAFVDRAIDALEAGTIDDREETTLSWTTMAVDELGWSQASEVLEEAMARLQTVHEQSRKRLEITGEEPIPIVTGIAAFEAAGSSEIGQ
ncbi:MAG TPA: ArsR family transcriptional regulator [Solirubrobacterales bacterium]|nr:ArsR family transcriptional regulator [Solirubrobacterales bacterium]